MKIAIIGAGFTGLSAAHQLIKNGYNVTVFEKDSFPGGLALGFKNDKWQWPLEKHYHHWFTNDDSVLNLAKELNYEVIIKRPKTSIYSGDQIYQLDSPIDVLTFQKLTVFERLRMAAVLGLLRYNPFWQPLEQIKAADFLPKAMGKNAYKIIWEPQLRNKFGEYVNEISLAWFWARVKKRTPSLAYPKEGFLSFANALVNKIEKEGGKVLLNTEVNEIKSEENISIKFKEIVPRSGISLREKNYDAVIVTLPSFAFLKIAPQLPQAYKEKLGKLKGLGAINLLLRFKKPFFNHNTYWLSICNNNSPVMAIIEHTNFMDEKYYDNEHLVYLGNYLPPNHRFFNMTKEEVLKVYDPFLQKIHPKYEQFLIDFHMFPAPFTQPIIPVNYSKIIPPFETPLKNVYLANIQQVYPWDRGTNYAVELGEKAAKLINSNEI